MHARLSVGDLALAKDSERSPRDVVPSPTVGLRDYDRSSAKRSECDLDGATEHLAPLNTLWVGVFRIHEARDLIEKIQDYQRKRDIADGYICSMLSPEIAFLHVWYDR